MSVASLLNAVVSRLRSQLTVVNTVHQIAIQDDGRPPDGFKGRVYVAVHNDGCRTSGAAVAQETYAFSVTVSVRGRVERVPDDRRGKLVVDTNLGIDSIAAAVKTALGRVPGNFATISAASTSGWVEAPVCIDEGQDFDEWEGWVSRHMRFDGAKRIAPGTGIT